MKNWGHLSCQNVLGQNFLEVDGVEQIDEMVGRLVHVREEAQRYCSGKMEGTFGGLCGWAKTA